MMDVQPCVSILAPCPDTRRRGSTRFRGLPWVTGWQKELEKPQRLGETNQQSGQIRWATGASQDITCNLPWSLGLRGSDPAADGQGSLHTLTCTGMGQPCTLHSCTQAAGYTHSTPKMLPGHLARVASGACIPGSHENVLIKQFLGTYHTQSTTQTEPHPIFL